MKPGASLRCFLLYLIMQAALHGASQDIWKSGTNGASAYVANRAMAREISLEGGILRTIGLQNLLNGKREAIPEAEEFSLTCSRTGAQPMTLKASDFRVIKTSFSNNHGIQELNVTLKQDGLPIELEVRYWAKQGDTWMRKEIGINAVEDVVIESIQVERIAVRDAYEPYRANQFTAKGGKRWRPPLGQPVYSKEVAAWWGVEFPAARNQVSQEGLACGYLTKVALKAGESVKSYPAAWGVADEGEYVKEAFFEYIDATRARPLRLQTQYNSWFDYGNKVDAEKFVQSVKQINHELTEKRGVPPLRAFVIDAGWEDSKVDWSKSGVWPVNAKFSPTFSECKAAVGVASSHLGLWLSPGCLFRSQEAIAKMQAAGWRTLDPWMSMTGEEYMSRLENRMVQLASDGVDFFKLDGIFGHLNQRNFDIEGFKGGEAELNDPRYDVQKERYLSLGSERLCRIFRRIGAVKPDIYIVISNGAYLSPWWLQWVDAVWMINAGDAASGADRREELVYRDERYYTLASELRDNTQFPLNSLFNHEPKKTSSGEPSSAFAHYLFMALGRGTGFVELYLKPSKLAEGDWDVLAEGLKWAHQVFPTFKRARMIGGDPTRNEVYGYTGWSDEQGYVALHNPADQEGTFVLMLDRRSGVTREALTRRARYRVFSPLSGVSQGFPELVGVGEQMRLTVPPRTTLILEFALEKRDKNPQGN